MNAKTMKLYEILIKYTENDFLSKKQAAPAFVNDLLALDFDSGLDGIYYMFTHMEKLFEFDSVRDALTNDFFEKLCRQNKTKTVKTLLGSPVLVKGFYTLNGKAYEGETLDALTALLLQGKTAEAEALLRALAKNEYAAFGGGMKTVVEEYLLRLKEKQGVPVPSVPKKTAALLQEFIDRIKGPEKPLLTQRLKELK
jgi:hypothetical protein